MRSASESIRPVAYISNITPQIMLEMGVKSNTSAKKRTDPQLKSCANNWVEVKFNAHKKQQLRSQLNPDNWRYGFVHGNVKEHKKLEFIASQGVKLLPFKQILNDLCTKQTNLAKL
ncbi:hypothetical protein ACFRCQ_25920 [Cytobacillus firmus]|uniref:hypothetical protein n=1 Tax=Cytobacillus firmus TaxID=1399 RepID=UPI0036B32AD3